MIILNLGCGTKTSDHPSVVNIDWSIMLRLKKNPALAFLTRLISDRDRLTRFEKIPTNILVHNLAKGIPFPDNSVDMVYHSHMLEHLDREVAEKFLLEVKRVLKAGGIHRIVVPDFELLSKRYFDHISKSDVDPAEAVLHESYISDIIEQSVRREPFGTSQQKKTRRFLENLMLGDARRRGETHRWMYDRISLSVKLKAAGYSQVFTHTFDASNITNWNTIGLDLDGNGQQYKADSLFMEAVK